MKVTLVQHTPSPEEHIGLLAGICYGKTGEQSPEQCIKRAYHCVTKGHLSTLRFAHATFLVEDISRICSHQFVRSKHLDFLQRSQRYCNEEETKVVIPESISKYDVQDFVYNAQILYENLIKNGVKKEDARFILPQALAHLGLVQLVYPSTNHNEFLLVRAVYLALFLTTLFLYS